MLCLGGGWGFLCECPLCCPAQLGGSLVTICLLRLRPAGVRFTLLLQALPCCCGLRPAATGYALLPCVIPCIPVYMGVVRAAVVIMACLCSRRLSLLWWVASATAGCLSNRRLCQQWQCTSIGVECLNNGRRPSPSELHHPGFSCACRETLNPEHFQSLFCLFL